ncbi:MAG: hypothetical protein KA282_04465 [Clostridia bacterium]|nr:hypothetical protein [Clostridia bacterium]
MNKTEHISYLMNEYQTALRAIETEKAWDLHNDEQMKQLKEANLIAGRFEWEGVSNYYSGRHVPKAELQRIRLMLHKEMLEVERG